MTYLLSALGAYLLAALVFAWAVGALAVREWLYQAFIACDQLANVLLTPWRAGAWADETMSSRTYRMWRDDKPWGRVMLPVIDWLFSWQELPPGAQGHCHAAWMKEGHRAHVPPELRDA